MSRSAIVTAITASALIAILAASPVQGAISALQIRSVLIRTHCGPCDATYRYPARIVGGPVTQA